MGVSLKVYIQLSTPKEAIDIIEAGIEHLESVMHDACAIVQEQKINLDDVDTTADTPVARIAAFAAADTSIEELRAKFDEICSAILDNLPSPDDFEAADRSEG